MLYVLLFVLIFQLGAIADVPALNNYAMQVRLANQKATADYCVTPQIEAGQEKSENTKKNFFKQFSAATTAKNKFALIKF